MFPYKVHTTQQLLPADCQARVQFSQAILNLVGENQHFPLELIMGDEAHFHLRGYVNKQNVRFWGTDNLRVIHKKPLHPLKVTVWCGVYEEKSLGPIFGPFMHRR
jgi:hypothetical protein